MAESGPLSALDATLARVLARALVTELRAEMAPTTDERPVTNDERPATRGRQTSPATRTAAA